MPGLRNCVRRPRSRPTADRRWVWLAALGLGLPVPLAAQTITGAAEVNVTQNSTASAAQANVNNAIGQLYTLGWSSSLINPRLARITAEVSLHRSSLTARSTQLADQTGKVHDVGYRFGTSLFPSGSIPLSFEASRLRSTSAGDLAPTNPIRGSAVVPGSLPLDFETETQLMSAGARLNRPRLPLVELNYRSGASVTAAGPYKSQQHDSDLAAAVTKDTARVHQTLRYQRTAFDSQFPQTFSQQLDSFDYDFSSALSSTIRLTAHAGQRTTNVQSLLQARVEDGTSPYELVANTGLMASRYASAGISWDPSRRLGFRLNGTLDRQHSADAAADALLGTASAHYTVVRGLTIEGSGTSGNRSQTLGGRTVQVFTQSGTAGATYRAGPRWLEAVVGVLRGGGINTSFDGQRGRSVMWSREGGLSSTIRWIGLGIGYERTRSQDQLLSLGNYDSERVRGSAQVTSGRVAVTLAGDRLWIARGDATTSATNLQRTFSGTTSYRFWQQNQITATAGGFSNAYWRPYGPGQDDTLFWSVGAQMSPRPNLQLSGWIRSETALASSSSLDQAGLGGFGRLDYRLRTLGLSLEVRNNRSRIQYGTATPDSYRGRQVRFSVTRRFGFSR